MEDTTIMHNPEDRFACLIPRPASIFESEGNFILSPDATIVVQKENNGIASIGNLLAAFISEATGNEIAVLQEEDRQEKQSIHLLLNGDASLGQEGYELSITTDSVHSARTARPEYFMASRLSGSFFRYTPLRPRLCLPFRYAILRDLSGEARCSTWRVTSSV